MPATPASPLRSPRQQRAEPARTLPPAPEAQALPAVLNRAAQDAARIADELLALHRGLAAIAAADAGVRATRYRLEDAAMTCRRASEEFQAPLEVQP